MPIDPETETENTITGWQCPECQMPLDRGEAQAGACPHCGFDCGDLVEAYPDGSMEE